MRLVLALALLALVACAEAKKPGTGGRTVLETAAETPDIPIAPPAERAEPSGPDVVQMVFAQAGHLRDPELEKFVAELGDELVRFAPVSPIRYRFFLVDQWSPNAFTLPGGEIFVSRGLMVLTNSEDELAGVLSHEIVHAAAHHALGRQAYVEGLSPFSLGLPRAASIAAYGREQERTADLEGQRIAAAAGYDPAGLPNFLKALGKVERLAMGGGTRIPTFLDTHPGTSERITSAVVLASTLPAPTAERADAKTRDEYLERLSGLVLGDDPAEGVVRGAVFLHPDLGIAVTFPSGTTVQNTPLAVVAVTKAGDARFALEDGGPGDDPEAVARAWMAPRMARAKARIDSAEAQQTLCCKAYVVRGLAETPQGVLAVQLAWVALKGHVYLLSAVSVPFTAKQTIDKARQMVRSLRELSAADRASIQIDQLRLVRAKQGETLAELSKRTHNAYDLHRTAIANDLEVTSVLDARQLIKIGVRGPYRPDQEPETAKGE